MVKSLRTASISKEISHKNDYNDYQIVEKIVNIIEVAKEKFNIEKI